MTTPEYPPLPERLHRAMYAAGWASIFMREGRAGELSTEVARIWEKHLGPNERLFLLATALQSAEMDKLGVSIEVPEL